MMQNEYNLYCLAVKCLFSLLFAVRGLLSAVFCVLSAPCCQLSSVCCLLPGGEMSLLQAEVSHTLLRRSGLRTGERGAERAATQPFLPAVRAGSK